MQTVHRSFGSQRSSRAEPSVRRRKSISSPSLPLGLGDLPSNSMRGCFSRFTLFDASNAPGNAPHEANSAALCESPTLALPVRRRVGIRALGCVKLGRHFTPTLHPPRAKKRAVRVSTDSAPLPCQAAARHASLRQALPMPATPLKSELLKALDDALDVLRRDLWCGQSDDGPSEQPRVKMFLGVVDESGGPSVPTATRKKDAAFEFDDHTARQMREIRPPFSLRVKPILPLQRRAAERLPEQQELSFEMRGAGLVAEAGT